MPPVLPAVLCIDLEPDRRLTERNDRSRPAGADALFPLVPRLRDRLSSTSGTDANITWFLRMDPQIAETYGSADWLATTYQRELDEMRRAGDAFGLHPHNWRWRDGGWVSDQADESWVAHCTQTSLDTFHATFGHCAQAYRHGDGFMSNAVARHIDEAGVRVDHTVEPGHAERPGIKGSETTTGSLPDTGAVPHHAYRPSRDDFRVPDHTRNNGVLFAPLTPGLVVSTKYRDGRLVPTGSYETLVLWQEPGKFARMLRAELRNPELSHLAFALRTDIGLLPAALAAVERNIDEIGRQLDGRHRWYTALEAADLIESRTTARPPVANRRAEPDGQRSARWLRGEADAGYQAGAEAEALEALMDDAGAIVGRLRALGVEGVAAAPSTEPATAELARSTGAGPASEPPLRWVDEPAEVSCPVCEYSGPARRVAFAQRGDGEIGVVRCPTCRAIVPERAGLTGDLPDEAIDGHVEFNAGIEAVLMTLGRIEPRRGLRFLDVGCGYGFALDLTRFAWGWRGVGVDPTNTAVRGREELGVEIRAGRLEPGFDLGDEPFDVALASEALEHIREPVAFLSEVHRRLARDGVLVLSTPNADFIRSGNSLRDVTASLGIGGHVFLVTRDGLERLLRRAGFEAVMIDEDVQTLRAVTSPTEAGLTRCRPATAELDLGLLARYCDERAASAARGSALRLGMAARHVQYALHANDLRTAEAGYGRLREALADRYGLDIEDPQATSERALHSALPAVAAGAHYSAGFLELVARDRPARAAAQFAAAAVAASSASAGRDPAIVWLQLRAIGHEALAHAQSEPSRAPGALHRLRRATHELIGTDTAEIDALCAAVFRELVARGHFDEGDAVRMLVTLPEAWIRDDHAVADGRSELDTVFALGALALHRGRAAEAMAYFGLCARLAESFGTRDARTLAQQARTHEALALDRLKAGGPPAEPALDAGDARRAGAVAVATPPTRTAAAPTRLGVSVVVPLFNGRRYLREAVESVAAQTMSPDELVVVDDGSADDGWRALDGIPAPFPIRVVHQTRSGQSAARNRGAASGGAELLAFLDQDDIWHPDHLAALTEPFHEDPSVGWVYSDFDEIDSEGRTVTLSFLAEHRVVHPRNTLAACLVEDLMVIPSASVMRRSMFDALGGFDPLLQGYEDDDLYVRAFRAGWRLVLVPRSLTRFRVHDASSSAAGRFIESRRYFSQKLRETVADDRRLNRFYSRDVIAPRFYRASLNDYVRALSDRDWAAARKLRADLQYFAGIHRDRAAIRWKLAFTRSPRLFRLILRVYGSLPFRGPRTKDSVYRLR